MTKPNGPATEKQLAFVRKLIAEKQLTADPEIMDRVGAMDEQEFAAWRQRQLERAEAFTKGQASAMIARLVKLPWERRATSTESAPLVPDGRYAVELDGEVKLYRVWRGTRNPNVQHLYAVRGVEKGERVRGAEELAAAQAIAVDPGAAAREFGHRTGMCSRCGQELSVNLSRKLGVGPSCLKHWYDRDRCSELRAAAREELRQAGVDPAEKLDSLEAVA